MEIDGAKLVGGLWLPATEQHFVAMMRPGARRHQVRDGRWTYQVHKLDRAMSYLPACRRRAAIDIGAHAGLWSVHLAGLFSTVHAFEPVPLHADCFRANLSGARDPTGLRATAVDGVAAETCRPEPGRIVNLFRCALGNRSGSVSMHVPEDTTGNAHVATAEPRSNGHGPLREVRDVALRRLDDFEFRHVDFVKIDVEGYELPVVQGAESTLLRERPLVVVEQKGNDAKFFQQPRNAALEALAGLGMKTLDVMSGDYILGW